MKYKVGDRVRVRRDLNVKLDCDPPVVGEMLCKAGDIVTISVVSNDSYRIAGYRYFWTDEMFEGLVEDELTAEEAIRLKCEMCESILCSECKFSRPNNGENIFCDKFLEKYPERAVEVLKQRKKDHEKKEVETEFACIVRVIEDLGDSKRCVYEEDVTEVKDETFKMTMKRVLKEYCKEHEGKFFTVYEEICRVKE